MKHWIIAGPCAVESYDLFSETARAVKRAGATHLRGGLYKMRTHNASFQGLGSEGFQVVKAVKEETGLPYVCEITDPRQLAPLEEIVDCFQVGARNMHNTALLKELGRTQKPVILKRAFSAYYEEWVAAADYIRHAGNPHVILCERGIRTFETAVRNTLDLTSVVYMKLRHGLDVLVDPSHATGQKDLIPPLALAAMMAGAAGLMLEVHPRPKEALSDGPQALLPCDFHALIEQVMALYKHVPSSEKRDHSAAL
jgi:3-deoxy-7-phosphoheptulonate synthase